MKKLDMTGKSCPMPVVEAKKALAEAAPGEEVLVLVDNDIARQNLFRLAEKHGCAFRYEARDGGEILTVFTLPETPLVQDEAAGVVVALGTGTLGRGDDKLGGMLAKSFIYSLTELSPPPEALLLFNSGVKLAVEEAPTLEDLRALEEKGVQIGVCGACLDYYGLKEKLAVGGVTNMYAIVSTMAGAARLVTL